MTILRRRERIEILKEDLEILRKRKEEIEKQIVEKIEKIDLEHKAIEDTVNDYKEHANNQ